MSEQGLSPKGRDIPAIRRVVLNDVSQLPTDYSTTPGGTFFSTTPGGHAGVHGIEVAEKLTGSSAPECGRTLDKEDIDKFFLRMGTRIVYDRSKLMHLRNSPLARSPPANMAKIPGITDFDAGADEAKKKVKRTGPKDENKADPKIGHDEHPQFEMDI